MGLTMKMTATTELNELMSQYSQWRRLEKQAKDEKEAIAAQIKNLMKEADATEIEGIEHKAIWTVYSRTSYDTKLMEIEIPEVAAKYRKETSADRLTVN